MASPRFRSAFPSPIPRNNWRKRFETSPPIDGFRTCRSTLGKPKPAKISLSIAAFAVARLQKVTKHYVRLVRNIQAAAKLLDNWAVEAVEAQMTGHPILILLSTQYCAYCERLKAEVLEPQVRACNKQALIH